MSSSEMYTGKQKSLEARFLALESSLGLLQPVNTEASSSASSFRIKHLDLTSRLDALECKINSFATPQSIWNESDELLRELHPQAALTYQEPSTRNDPIYYRKQQVLASVDDLKRDFAVLNRIMNLLLISQPASKLTEEQVTQAPILVSTTTNNPDDQVRLEKLLVDIHHTRRQAMDMTRRVDSLIQTYHVVVASLSERMLLLHQKIAAKELH